MKIGTDYYWYQNDHNGTPQKLIATNGLVVWDGKYNAFGDCQITNAAVTNNLRFAGQYFDGETGLHYNFNRYYDPQTGRYLKTDPFGDGLNLYAYCAGNPIGFIDPLGLCKIRDGWNWWVDFVAVDFNLNVDSADGLDWEVTKKIFYDNFMNAVDPMTYAEAFHDAFRWPMEHPKEVMLLVLLRKAPNSILSKAAKSETTVIGRIKDLKNLKQGERSLLDRLPNRGGPKANWKQNSGVLRQEMAKGRPIRDASPGDEAGQFLNAERNLLKNHGWTFDPKTNYWMPPR